MMKINNIRGDLTDVLKHWMRLRSDLNNLTVLGGPRYNSSSDRVIKIKLNAFSGYFGHINVMFVNAITGVRGALTDVSVRSLKHNRNTDDCERHLARVAV